MNEEDPTNDELEEKIRELLPCVDLEKTGLKAFYKLLATKFRPGLDLSGRKAFIRQALTDLINSPHDREIFPENNMKSGEDRIDDEELGDDLDIVGGTIELVASNEPVSTGLKAKKKISDQLAAFLKKGSYMARTEVVKCLWDYIKDNQLQNPKNRKEILLDDAMKAVFGVESFDMFSMQKYVGAHIDPFRPVDLTSISSSETRSRKRPAKVATSKTEKKRRKSGTQPPYRLSSELEEVVGASELPRPQVVSAIWAYIKAKNLQDPNNKQVIVCDEKLRAVMKKAKVTMFNMNQLITPHLLERVSPKERLPDDED